MTLSLHLSTWSLIFYFFLFVLIAQQIDMEEISSELVKYKILYAQAMENQWEWSHLLSPNLPFSFIFFTDYHLFDMVPLIFALHHLDNFNLHLFYDEALRSNHFASRFEQFHLVKTINDAFKIFWLFPSSIRFRALRDRRLIATWCLMLWRPHAFAGMTKIEVVLVCLCSRYFFLSFLPSKTIINRKKEWISKMHWITGEIQ